MNKSAVLLFLMVLLHHSYATALEPFTHVALNDEIANNAIGGFLLNNCLKEKLGFENGIMKEINGKQILEWLSEAGGTEDEPVWRSFNHFHNPLKPWNEAGLNDAVWGAPFAGQSSVLWAQNDNQSTGGYWSWHDARNYFYAGLTLPTKAEREVALANTFRALGQLMHLVQDASVPAHVRNDIHLRYNYESWVNDIQRYEEHKFKEFISSSIFNKEILKINPNSLAPVPIARIMDTDQYVGINPDVTAGGAIGIAEYANANFFSRGTVFSEKFPYPSWNSVEKEDYSIPDPRYENTMTWRQYYKKVRDGDAGYRIATVGFLRDYIDKYFVGSSPFQRPALDGGVYEDYARRLLPRAVGYSAGLLEYFFRGKLAIEQLDSGYISIRNLSSENMEGTFAFYYDAADGKRRPVPNGSWSLLINAGSVSDSIRLLEPDDLGEEANYILVFRGKMGDELDGVVGQVWAKKYHWTSVVDYPPFFEDRYTGPLHPIPETHTGCPHFDAWEYEQTITDHCQESGFIRLYLVASDQRLQNENVYRGCKDNLKSFYLGEFTKGSLYSKMFYQIYREMTYWRYVEDAFKYWVCPLITGETAYAIDFYTVEELDPMISLSWKEILVDSPVIKQIREQLYPDHKILFAAQASNLDEGDYGRRFLVDHFIYAMTSFPSAYYAVCSQDETSACYSESSGSKCDPSHLLCFTVVQNVPHEGPRLVDKRVKMILPEMGREFFLFDSLKYPPMY